MISHQFVFAPGMSVKNIAKVCRWQQEAPKNQSDDDVPPQCELVEPAAILPHHVKICAGWVNFFVPDVAHNEQRKSEARHVLAPLSEVLEF